MRRILRNCAILMLGLLVGVVLMVPRPWSSVAAIPPAPLSGDVPPSLHLAVMGTSLTARYDWPAALGDSLSACLGVPVEMTVVAGSGETSRWGLNQIDPVLARPPDIVVMEFSINDADLRHRMSPAQSQEVHEEIIAQVYDTAPQARILLAGTNPVFGLRGLLRPRISAYLTMYTLLAQENPQTGLLDLNDAWHDRIALEGRTETIPDGIHPTADASRAVIVPALATTLAGLWAQDCPT